MSASGHKPLPGRHLSRKAFCIALPGIPTGLFTMTMSSFRALRYACLYASAASHSSVVTNGFPAVPRSPEGQAMLQIPPVINTACSDQWNFQFCRLPDHCRQFSLIALRCVSVQFLPLKSQVSARQRSLCHDKVRLSVVFFIQYFVTTDRARVLDTIGASIVRWLRPGIPLSVSATTPGRSNGSPAPEIMQSVPASTAALT